MLELPLLHWLSGQVKARTEKSRGRSPVSESGMVKADVDDALERSSRAVRRKPF
jgi:hypothetical protein